MTRFTRFATVVLFAVCTGMGAASAADYPTRPVKWVMPDPPGGTTDVLARIMAQWLTEKMGHSSSSRIGQAAATTSAPRWW